MVSHLKAWEDEYTRSTWRGPYNIEPMKAYLKPGAHILDVGCGNGKILDPLARAGFEVTGIDISRNALLGLPRSMVQGDARNLAFKNCTFEAVVCYDVLQHLLEGERNEAVREMSRVLAPGGMLFLQVFGRMDMRYGGTLVEPDTFRRHSGIIYHYFSEDEVRSSLSGFNIITVDSAVSKKIFRGEAFTRHKITAVAQK